MKVIQDKTGNIPSDPEDKAESMASFEESIEVLKKMNLKSYGFQFILFDDKKTFDLELFIKAFCKSVNCMDRGYRLKSTGGTLDMFWIKDALSNFTECNALLLIAMSEGIINCVNGEFTLNKEKIKCLK